MRNDNCQQRPALYSNGTIGQLATYDDRLCVVTGVNPAARTFTLSLYPDRWASWSSVRLSEFKFTGDRATDDQGAPEPFPVVFDAIRDGSEQVIRDSEGMPVAVVVPAPEYVRLLEAAKWGRG